MLLGEHMSDLPPNLQQAIQAIQEGEWAPQPVTLAYECATCEDLGQIRYAVDDIKHPLFGKMFPCPDCAKGQQLIAREIEKRLSAAQLPAQYKKLTFETWMEIPETYRVGKGLAYACAKLFAENPDHEVNMKAAYQMCNRVYPGGSNVRRSLILQGEPGLGKTGLVSAIIREMLINKQPVLYIRVQDLLEAVKDSFDKPGDDSTEKVLDTVKKFPTLVLDEFNMIKVSEWRQEIMENVIRYRHGNNLPTVFTCNAAPDELERQWGLRTISVLGEMAHFVQLGGKVLRDYRQPDEVF